MQKEVIPKLCLALSFPVSLGGMLVLEASAESSPTCVQHRVLWTSSMPGVSPPQTGCCCGLVEAQKLHSHLDLIILNTSTSVLC